MSTSAEQARGVFDLQRLVFFNDAVFAIVITLLVLPLTAEVDLAPGAVFAAEVWELWPKMVGFIVSFLVVGQFWVVHHRLYSQFSSCNAGLIWLNLVSLLTVSFMPFPAAVLGEHSHTGSQLPVVFFAASLAVVSATFTLTWLYALRAGLVDPSVGPAARLEHTVRSLLATGVFLLTVVIAFLGLLPAALCWIVLLPLIRRVVVRRQRGRALVT
jgi:uncharacterized membrane protein